MIFRYICYAILLTLVCLGLAERGNGADLTIDTYPPPFYFDSDSTLHNPGLTAPLPQRSTVRVVPDPYESIPCQHQTLCYPTFGGVRCVDETLGR